MELPAQSQFCELMCAFKEAAQKRQPPRKDCLILARHFDTIRTQQNTAFVSVRSPSALPPNATKPDSFCCVRLSKCGRAMFQPPHSFPMRPPSKDISPSLPLSGDSCRAFNQALPFYTRFHIPSSIFSLFSKPSVAETLLVTL